MITGTKEESADWKPEISQYIERRVEAVVTERLETLIQERVAQAMQRDPAKRKVAIIASS